MDTTTDTTTDDVHVCPCCGIPAKNRRTFNDHLETQSNVEYCCEQCGKVFASKRRMYVHVQKYHAFKYHCQECDKICHSLSSLNNHYKLDFDHNIFHLRGIGMLEEASLSI